MRQDALIWLLGFIAVLAMLIALGCTKVSPSIARQKAVQDCILSGGHARLGPGDTILCERRFQ